VFPWASAVWICNAEDGVLAASASPGLAASMAGSPIALATLPAMDEDL